MPVVVEPDVLDVPEAPEIGVIEREAARLDRLFPGWHNRINTSTLDIPNTLLCVLAQGAPHVPYGVAIDIVNAEREAEGIDYCDGAYAQNKWLPDWLREIRKRRR